MMKTEKATFGAGCFWHVEDEFRKIKGVANVTVGYMGGSSKNPSYENVCCDKTGHAEVAQVEYDPSKVSYEKLLDAFFKMHNPTQINQQGMDIGTQYRSVIFYHNEKQKKSALGSKKKLEDSKVYAEKVATEIKKASTFYKAEEYHQNYYSKNNLKTCFVPLQGIFKRIK